MLLIFTDFGDKEVTFSIAVVCLGCRGLVMVSRASALDSFSRPSILGDGIQKGLSFCISNHWKSKPSWTKFLLGLSEREVQLIEQHSLPRGKFIIHYHQPTCQSALQEVRPVVTLSFLEQARVESLNTGLGVRRFEFESGHCHMNLGKSSEFSKTRFLYLWNQSNSRPPPRCRFQRVVGWKNVTM